MYVSWFDSQLGGKGYGRLHTENHDAVYEYISLWLVWYEPKTE